ncbi:hypothetical protein Cyast_0651 [Cyanobacterium stanieri PCC 7202]|uniref:peptidylprolyl isomerase n=1 Tax=Cyanobacterium stanieri (strain ATCC 29140 / PCC 7202) TaxID=292563 RepID=K9YJI3_CYASC|nr:hypothetical protein Cyast_0651 [Cyanobacterium stanieri PCC 7202]
MINSFSVEINKTIGLNEFIDYLKKNFQLKDISQKIIEQKVVDRKAQELDLVITDDEIQEECDRQRQEKRLEKAADTMAWLTEQMVSVEVWEQAIYDKLLRKKLANELFGEEVKAFFSQNKINFEQVVLYQIIVPYNKLAWEILYQIEEEEMSFYHAAHLYDVDEKRRLNCGYEGKIYRWSLPPDISAKVFSAKEKQPIVPFQTEQGYHILMVENFIEAELTEEICHEILDKMFEQWLMTEISYVLHDSAPRNTSP